MDIRNSISWSNKLSIRLFITFVLGLSLFLVLTSILIYKEAQEFLLEKELDRIYTSNYAITNELLHQTTYVSSLAHSISSTSSRLPLNNGKYKNIIKKILASAPNQHLIAGGGVWPEPRVFSPYVDRNSFFWGKDNSNQLQFFDDYNDPTGNGYHQEAWYVPAKHILAGKQIWSGSYVDPYSMAPMVTVSVPIYRSDRFFGVSTVDMNLSGIEQLMTHPNANESVAYSFIVDLSGNLITSIDGLTKYTDNRYPSLEELSLYNSAFKDILSAIKNVTYSSLNALNSNSIDTVLKNTLEKESYQIDDKQAQQIAAIIQQEKHFHTQELHQTVIEIDSAPIIEQASYVVVTEMPETYWKIVNILPKAQISSLVQEGVARLLIPMTIISALILVLFYVIVYNFFIKKVTLLTEQLIDTDLTKINTTVNYSDNGELGLIAKLLNEQILRLRNLTEQLTQSKQELELRIKISQSLQHPIELRYLLKDILEAICNSQSLQLEPAGAVLFLTRSGHIKEVFAEYGNINLDDFSDYQHKKTAEITIVENKYLIPLKLDNKNKGVIVLFAKNTISKSTNKHELDALSYIGYMINLAISNEAARLDLIEEKANAEKANKAKSEFLASMSHELRTPLNAILGFSQLLKKSTKDTLSEQQKNQLHFIIDGGKHLLKLINQVLELSAIEAGKIKIELQDISLIQSVSRTIDLAKPLSIENNISLHLDSKTDIALRADKTKLDQIMLNLVTNAIKYNRPNGHVHIEWKKLNHDFAQLKVTDTGIGIPKHNFDAVFDPFNRLGKEASNIEGTGIGLSVTKDLIKLMGGKIYFESEVDQGTTFFVELPLALELLDLEFPSVEVHNETLTTDRQLTTDTSILYVEDIPTNQALMKSFFKQWNHDFELEIADSAEQARQMLQEQQYDLILMDLNLPGESGNSLTAALKRDEKYKDIPIIALTARAMREDVQAVEHLFDAYITKPVNFIELTLALENHLNISL